MIFRGRRLQHQIANSHGLPWREGFRKGQVDLEPKPNSPIPTTQLWCNFSAGNHPTNPKKNKRSKFSFGVDKKRQLNKQNTEGEEQDQ